MNNSELVILKTILLNKEFSQRKLSKKLGMSLGKVNKELTSLRSHNILNDHLNLTLEGEKLIKDSQPHNAIILAAGFGMRMIPINTETPKALIKIKGEVLIERLITQLHQVGITDIQIVIGFMKEYFEYLIDKCHVKLIVNKDYATTNSLYSLYLAKNKLGNTYVIPSDVWFKNNPFSQIETHSWYLMSKEKNNIGNYRVNHNYDIVNSTPSKGYNTEIGGVAYLLNKDSQNLKSRLEECVTKSHQERFWEQAITTHKGLALPAKLMSLDDAIEINTYEQLLELDENASHLRNDAIKIIEKTLKVNAHEIKNITVLKKGMTNRSFKFECQGKKYIMRIPGSGTAKLIDRSQEAAVYQVIKPLKISEPVLYLNPNNGYKLTAFLTNTHNCDVSKMNEVHNCIQFLKRFHELHLKVAHSFDLYHQINFYEKLRGTHSIYQDYEITKKHILGLKQFIDKQPHEWTLCHIDANADNFLINNDDPANIHLIDWEYAGMQDPHVDIAMFGIYALYDKKQMDELLMSYFEKEISNKVRAKIYAYIATCGLLWSNWCEYKQKLGIDFGEYSLAQYRYAKEYYHYAQELIGENK